MSRKVRSWRFLLIGGAADKTFANVVDLAGGNGNIVVVPHASGDPAGAAADAVDNLRRFGARDVRVIMPDEPFSLTPQDRAVFVTGGDQSRLVERLGEDGKVELRRFLDGGGLYAGTSAGAAAVGRKMIAGGMGDGIMAAGALEVGAGLDLVPGLIVDTHFGKRQRHTRPLMALAVEEILAVPGCAIGLDEDTAVFLETGVRGRVRGKVIGSGLVWLYEPTRHFRSSLFNAKAGELVSVTGVKLSALNAYSNFLLKPEGKV